MTAQDPLAAGPRLAQNAPKPPSPYIRELEDLWAAAHAPRLPDAPTVISTFAGAGGSSLGYAAAGFRELMVVEWNAAAAESFRANFPGIPVHHGDIAKLEVDELLANTGLIPGQLDVFDGSPPCQGFSTAGTRQLDDPRNQLFRDFVRLLRGLKPKAFVMENVSGLVKSKMRPLFVEILAELKASGYQVRAAVLNAADFGVPQQRLRTIFIGARDDLGLTPTFPAIGKPLKVTVSHALGHLPIGEATVTASALDKWKRSPMGHRKKFNTPKINRLDPNDRSPTIVSVPPYHWHVARPITPDESKLLQSFPEAFRLIGTKVERQRQVGNAVAPLMMRAIAREIRKSILGK